MGIDLSGRRVWYPALKRGCVINAYNDTHDLERVRKRERLGEKEIVIYRCVERGGRRESYLRV